MKQLHLVFSAQPAIDAPPRARVLTAGVRLTAGFRAATVRERPPARILHAALLSNPAAPIGRP